MADSIEKKNDKPKPNEMAKAWLKQYFDDSNFPEWTKGSRGITVPLSFPEKESSPFLDKDRTIVCLLCEESFEHPLKEKEFLLHLTCEHRFIIANIEMVSDLPSYVAYWRDKFVQAKVVTDFCKIVKMKSGDGENDPEVDFFLLSDVCAEDKELRMHLQLAKLEHVLAVQEKERNNAEFKRACFFCRMEFEGSHSKLLDHMAFDHNFSVGQPHNLVYVEKLLDILEEKLEKLVCIYCEKIFKSREVLKEHMRKKNHKKINPRDSNYDKYYLVNYLEFGKSWEKSSKDKSDKPFEDEDLPTGFDSDRSDEGNENDWSDWRGNLSGAVCLFCPANYTDFSDILNHMNIVHFFDYGKLKSSLSLNFYQQIKLINYVRRQMHLLQCMYCDEKFDDFEVLFNHMKSENHLKPPEARDEWDTSQFYFPTYENDNFLCLIEDEEDSKSDELEAPVLPQELSEGFEEAILFKEEYRKQIQPKHQKKKK